MSQYRNILALDLATSFGFAQLKNGQITWGSYRLPSTGEDVGQFLCAYEDWLGFVAPGLDLVIYEAPFVGEKTGQQVARKLLSLAGETERKCRRLEITCREENISIVRSHFIPGCPRKRDVIKARVMERCRDLGWSPRNDDEGDALALLDYTMNVYRVASVTPGPLFKQDVA